MTRVLRTNADPTEKRTNIRAVLLLVWLVIGALAAAERGNSTSGDTTCAGASTIAVTVLPGPLDYVGVDPQSSAPSSRSRAASVAVVPDLTRRTP